MVVRWYKYKMLMYTSRIQQSAWPLSVKIYILSQGMFATGQWQDVYKVGLAKVPVASQNMFLGTTEEFIKYNNYNYKNML